MSTRQADSEPSKQGSSSSSRILPVVSTKNISSSVASSSDRESSQGQQSRLSGVAGLVESDPKYGEANPSEFQSLKLESLVTMEEMKAVSESFSTLLEKEIKLSKQYSEVVPGYSQNSQDSKSLDSSEEETDAEQFFGSQIHFFGDMKQFLISQNISLQQNLELLVLKMNRTTPLRKSDSELLKLSDSTGAIGTQNQELEALRQWGSPTSKNKNEIQICPVCGVEFEHNETTDLLEEHVAGHWCSQGSV